METIQTFIQTIWASVLALGAVKAVIVVVTIAFLTRFQYILGMLAAILFVAFLAHWIVF